MDCQNLSHNAAPMPWRHRMRCAQCRAAYSADQVIARELTGMKAGAAPADGLRQTLTAVGLTPDRRGRHASIRRPLYRRLAVPGGSFSAAVALSAVAWLHYVDIAPRVSIPTPRMPVLNAFDRFNQAARLMKDSNTIQYAVGNGPIPETAANDINDYPPKPAGMHTRKINGMLLKVPADGKEMYSPKDRVTLIQENRSALSELREGLKLPYLVPPVRSFGAVFAVFPEYSTDRALARLLSLEARTRSERGDWFGAVNSDLDAMQLGAMIPHGAPVFGRTLGNACQAIGRQPLWKIINKLNAGEATSAVRRMEAIEASTTSLYESLTEEKWMGQAAILEAFRQPQWRETLLTGDFAHDAPSSPIPDIEYLLKPGYALYAAGKLRNYRYSKRRILSDYTRILDQDIEDARRGRSCVRINTGDPYMRILEPMYSDLRDQELTGTIVQNGLLKTTFALRAYHQEHHHYPDTLAALMPNYLRRLPLDPYANGNAFGYRLSESNYVLYSVGPSGKNHGTAPVYSPGDQSYESPRRRNGKGDIISGVNVD